MVICSSVGPIDNETETDVENKYIDRSGLASLNANANANANAYANNILQPELELELELQLELERERERGTSVVGTSSSVGIITQ